MPTSREYPSNADAHFPTSCDTLQRTSAPVAPFCCPRQIAFLAALHSLRVLCVCAHARSYNCCKTKFGLYKWTMETAKVKTKPDPNAKPRKNGREPEPL